MSAKGAPHDGPDTVKTLRTIIWYKCACIRHRTRQLSVSFEQLLFERMTSEKAFLHYVKAFAADFPLAKSLKMQLRQKSNKMMNIPYFLQIVSNNNFFGNFWSSLAGFRNRAWIGRAVISCLLLSGLATCSYGVATISRLLKITCLFRRISSLS